MIGLEHFVLHALFVFEDLPALEAEDVSVAFGFRPLEILEECLPLFGIFADHER
jgi:hypothetical protein